MNEFFSWGMLATFAGATTATALLTQFLKGIFSKLPTQLLSYLIAVVILIPATIFTTGADWSSLLLIPLNAAIVSLASNGAYDAILRAKDGKDE